MFHTQIVTELSRWHAPALVIFISAEEKNARAAAFCPALQKTVPWLKDSAALAEFSANPGSCAVVYSPGKSAFPRVIFAGLGKKERLVSRREGLDALREAAGAAARFCREMHVDEFAVSLPDLFSLFPKEQRERVVTELFCGAAVGLYRQTTYKSDGEKQRAEFPDPSRLLLLGEKEDAALAATVKKASVAAEGVLFARELINGPANIVTPSYMAKQALMLADRCGGAMRCQVLTPAEMQTLGMNALLAVSAGAANEPRFIILEYAPRGHAAENPVVLIGKGLTFDSGGISLKPAAGMEAMKDDMSGAAAVLGVFHALGGIRPGRRVIGLLPCTENMPGGTAARPGDVVKTLSGQTVEIVNTDAEGRLVLCDALTYAQKRWKPSLMIDLATLTGACVVALGNEVAGVFSRDLLLPERILGLGEMIGERYWPLPLWDMYFETLKSSTADFANAGTREGGACSAAAFLARFVNEDVRWAHLDIAGPAYAKPKGNDKAGARGFAVRLLLELILDM